MISLIVAASTNNVIGVAGGLPWHLSDDLKLDAVYIEGRDAGNFEVISRSSLHLVGYSGVRTMLDDDSTSTTATHSWYKNGTFNNTTKLAEIQEDGDMRIGKGELDVVGAALDVAPRQAVDVGREVAVGGQLELQRLPLEVKAVRLRVRQRQLHRRGTPEVPCRIALLDLKSVDPNLAG